MFVLHVCCCGQVIMLRGTTYGTSPRGEEDVGLFVDPQDRPRRAMSKRWSWLTVILAFVDWFHIAFNLMNLNVIRSTKITLCNGNNARPSVDTPCERGEYVRLVFSLSAHCRHSRYNLTVRPALTPATV